MLRLFFSPSSALIRKGWLIYLELELWNYLNFYLYEVDWINWFVQKKVTLNIAYHNYC